MIMITSRKVIFLILILCIERCRKIIYKRKKAEIEILFMYYWLHDMEGDEEGYWQQYLETVLPALNKE